MNQFKDFNIVVENKSFTGDKIKIDRLLNRQIVIHEHKIEPSDYTEKRLVLQIETDGQRRIIFTGSKVLMEQIQRVPKEGFPFTATITKDDNGRYDFT
jgi:hypothetical protein